jgi:hypothetical protein
MKTKAIALPHLVAAVARVIIALTLVAGIVMSTASPSHSLCHRHATTFHCHK